MLGLEFKLIKTLKISTNIGDFNVEIFKDKCSKYFKIRANQISLIDMYGEHKAFGFPYMDKIITPDIYKITTRNEIVNYRCINTIEYKPLDYKYDFVVYSLIELNRHIDKFSYDLKIKNTGWELTAIPRGE